MPVPELELLHAHGEICVLFAHRDVNITVWHRGADVAAVNAVEPAVTSRFERFTKVSVVHLIMHTAGLPSGAARTALAGQARKWPGRMAAVAVVIEHGGFFASAMRSAITGIQMVLVKPDFPVRMFSNAREAADWLPAHHAERTGHALDAAALFSALQAAREPRAASPAAVSLKT